MKDSPLFIVDELTELGVVLKVFDLCLVYQSGSMIFTSSSDILVGFCSILKVLIVSLELLLDFCLYSLVFTSSSALPSVQRLL